MAHFRQLKNKFGRLLKPNSRILKQWQEHFKEISAVESEHPPVTRVLMTCVTYNGVASTISKMKDDRVVDADDIPSEFCNKCGLLKPSGWLA